MRFFDGAQITITEDDEEGRPDTAGLLDKEF